MADERERGRQRGGGSDDLFEDLDRFFAAVDESEWPDVDEAAEPSPARGSGARAAGDVGVEASGGAAAGEFAPGERALDEAGLDALRPEDLTGLDALDLGDSGGPVDDRSDVSFASVVSPPEPAAPEPPPTREMTSEEWARLRDVLGDEDERDDDFQFTDVPTELGPSDLSPEESLFGYAAPDEPEPAADDVDVDPAAGTAFDPAADELAPESWDAGPVGGADMDERPDEIEQPAPGELTLDDLKKAPPEYRDLPTESDEPDASLDDLLDEPPPPDVTSDTQTFEVPSPALADVEAAADHLAEEFTPPGDVDDDLLEPVRGVESPRRTVKVGQPEALLGPAWEDPTSETVTAAPAPASADAPRNLPMAVLTAAGLAVLALVLLLVANWAFAALAGLVILAGQLELYTAMKRRHYQPATILGLVLGVLALAGAYTRGEPAILFVFVLGTMLSFLWYMAAVPKARTGIVGNIGATMLGVLYVPGLAGYVFLILTSGGSGRALMLAVLGLTFLNDIAAFGFGSIWGSQPLAPTISPRKSREGLLMASFATVIVAMALVTMIDGMTFARAVGLGLIVCVFAPLGDLAESLLKRDLGLKDMGNVLPGHGGVLDRIDSALFVAPAAFYFLRLIF